MNLLRALILLAPVAAGCTEAHAQPRRDAGARTSLGAVRTRSRGLVLLLGDAGIPPAFLDPSSDDTADILASAAAVTTPVGPAPAAGAGLGGLGAPASDGRFDDPERLAGVPLGEARSWLAVAGGWAHRCLERAREVPPFEAPVRFTVARDGSVTGVSAEGAPEGGVRCLAEGFGHARFRPVATPAELVARYRYTVRRRPARATPDAGAPPHALR